MNRPESPEHPCHDSASQRHPLRCDCCGSETLAERVGDKIVIRDKRHGRLHILVVPLDKGDQKIYPELEFKDVSLGG